MAYDSYKLLQSQSVSMKDKMMEDKKKQVAYLYNIAPDREEGCTINNLAFAESPRIFDRKIKTSYFQTLTCETININDRFKSGSILHYDNDYWLCTSSLVFHNLYCKGNFIRCNYKLKWQEPDGSIVERNCFVQSSSQTNSGEDENKTIVLGADQLLIVLPSDEKTLALNASKRLFVDKYTVKPTPYKITRTDTVPYSDWDDGCVNLIVKQVEVSPSDRPDLMLCDYISPTTPPDPGEPSQSGILCTITYKGDASIIVGGNAKTFTAVYTDADGNDVSGNYTTVWSVVGNPISELSLTPAVNSVKIKCAENDKLINTAFTLKAIGTYNAETIETTLSVSLKSIY